MKQPPNLAIGPLLVPFMGTVIYDGTADSNANRHEYVYDGRSIYLIYPESFLFEEDCGHLS